MEMNLNNDGEAQGVDNDENSTPLLEHKSLPDATTIQRNSIQQVLSQTLQYTAHLANLLPTGTVMTFQLLAPISTNLGECDDLGRVMTCILVALCGLSAFILSFTDSFKDRNGNVFYGFATRNGLWVIDCSTVVVPPSMANKYRLCLLDFLHAFVSVIVFAAIALFNRNTVQCFYPMPSRESQQVLTILPVAIGVICSLFFVLFLVDGISSSFF